MTSGLTPNIPKRADEPNAQRLLAGLDEFIRTVLRTSIFVARAEANPKIQTRQDGEIVQLKWGAFNRVQVNAAGCRCQLPAIVPQWIGQPLYLAKTSADGFATLTPTGRSVDKRAVPTVNDEVTLSLGNAGLYILMTDGQNWFCSAEP